MNLPASTATRTELSVVAFATPIDHFHFVKIFAVAFASFAFKTRVALANATLFSALKIATRATFNAVPVTLAFAIANHVQIDVQGVLEADRVDFDSLVPFVAIRRTRFQLNLQVKDDLVANAKVFANISLFLSISKTGRGVGDTDITGGVILQLNGRGDLFVLVFNQLYNVRGVTF